MAKNYYGRRPPQWGRYRQYGDELSTYYANRYSFVPARVSRGYAKAKAASLYARKRSSYGFGDQNFKVYPDVTVAAGTVVGLSDIDRMVPGQLWLLGAALPIGGKLGRKIRSFCGGVILGELASQYTGFKIPIGTAQTKDTKNTSVAALYSA